jgi:hypothetical protein
MTTVRAFSNASLVRICRAVMPRRISSTTASPDGRRSRRGGSPGPAGRRCRAGHAEGLGRARHRVGGEHAAAGALAGARVALDVVELLAGDAADRAGADALEGVLDGDVAVADPAGQGRPGVQEDGGEVEPGGGHQHARLGLVAPGEQDGAVQALGVHHALHGVRDDLAADQAGAHALVTHRDAVGHRDGAELQREPAGLVHALLRRLGQPVEREVARGDLVPGRGHPICGFSQSSSPMPTARSIARAGARS